MKIGIISPLSYPVPPKKYGGIELVVYYLVEGLIKRGHSVTLFAAGNSNTSARLDNSYNSQIKGGSMDPQNILYCLSRINHITSRSHHFDIMHNHDGFLAISQEHQFQCPIVSTWHVPIGKPKDVGQIQKKLLKQNKIISISYAQRENFPQANFIANVYNGPVDLSTCRFGKGGDYLIWIGRFDEYKGAKEAIEAATLLKKKIVLAGQVETQDQKKYFSNYIKTKVDNKNVIFLGQIGIREKIFWLGKSKVFLMPVSWREPFGLVVPEANACGTPVVAFARGAMPELIKDRINGFLVKPNDIQGMVQAVKRIYDMPEGRYKQMRLACRAHVAKNFTVEKMVDGYERVYERVIDDWKKRKRK